MSHPGNDELIDYTHDHWDDIETYFVVSAFVDGRMVYSTKAMTNEAAEDALIYGRAMMSNKKMKLFLDKE